jgi:hypothetical protein
MIEVDIRNEIAIPDDLMQKSRTTANRFERQRRTHEGYPQR